MNTRRRILAELDGPRCPRELAERTGLHPRAVLTALARMGRDGLVECVTPHLRQGRLFRPTMLGRLARRELARVRGDSAPDVDVGTYAFVQAGTYRRLIVEHLDEPADPRQLRQRICTTHQRMGINHVHATLRELRARGLVVDADGVWSLTEAGRRIRSHALSPAASDRPSGSCRAARG
jgi:DNA-binding transcriptional ArsR family regulator